MGWWHSAKRTNQHGPHTQRLSVLWRKFQVPHHFISSIQNLLVVLHNQYCVFSFQSRLFRKKVNQELILVISKSSSFFTLKLWWREGGRRTGRLERLLSQQTLCCLITMEGVDSKHWDLRPPHGMGRLEHSSSQRFRCCWRQLSYAIINTHLKAT